MSVREIIKKNRVICKLSQGEVAKVLGKPQSYISKIEQGERRVDVDEFIAICFAIGIDPINTLKEVIMEKKHESSF